MNESSSYYSKSFESASLLFELFSSFNLNSDDTLFHVSQNNLYTEFSFHDFCIHINKAVKHFALIFPEVKPKSSLIFLTENSYNSFVYSLASLLSGFNILFLPKDSEIKVIEWCKNYFESIAVVYDGTFSKFFCEDLGNSFLNISDILWTNEDKKQENEIIKTYYDSKNFTSSLNNQPMKEVGKISFVSIGHDGIRVPITLSLNTLVETAHNFVIHARVPASIFWKSFEVVPNSNPFSHLSRLCALINRGVIGFPSHENMWLDSYKKIQPTFFFTSSKELNKIQKMARSEIILLRNKTKQTFGHKIGSCNLFIDRSKNHVSDATYHFFKNSLRLCSRIFTGKKYIEETVGKLRFVVHGLSPAQGSHVSFLEKFGIPVIETYGVTQAAGMLSANQFYATQLHSIGTPLPHVSFRLGQQSVLEYKIHSAYFDNPGEWFETGDVAQMTSAGYIITGRKRHLIKTFGGILVSPARLEKSLLGHNNIIADACVVGDK